MTGKCDKRYDYPRSCTEVGGGEMHVSGGEGEEDRDLSGWGGRTERAQCVMTGHRKLGTQEARRSLGFPPGQPEC